MARARTDTVYLSDDEFPDLARLVPRQTQAEQRPRPSPSKTKPQTIPKIPTATPSIRRRKLGQVNDNTLLRTWDGSPGGRQDGKATLKENTQPRRSPIHLRDRKPGPIVQVASLPKQDEVLSTEFEVTFVEEVSADDASEFHISLDSSSSDEGGESDASDIVIPRNIPAKALSRSGQSLSVKPSRPQDLNKPVHGCSGSELAHGGATTQIRKQRGQGRAGINAEPNSKGGRSDLPAILSALCLDDDESVAGGPSGSTLGRPTTTPPLTPPRPRAVNLTSPKKLARIPITPHRPSSDMFWSQEFVNEWNDEHSPKKQLFRDVSKSPEKIGSPPKIVRHRTAEQKATKKAFEQNKHALAASFLAELDATVTSGRISELAASTGGVVLNWTNKLNTTAGRASWKRETVRTKSADDGDVVTTHRHHASIELAEKVIDDEQRLLNVLAHEFCHLANFMVSGVTGNPHGREFKSWASKCSRAFGHRGIEVTTRHNYDIDFKYVWECVACAANFKRHSKSIDPARHRCGTCKGELKQTRPMSRKMGETGPTEYQRFMKEQMRVVRGENPGSPQKEIMKLVADKWSKLEKRSPAKQPGNEAAGGRGGLANRLEAVQI